ncbi:MAG TPA: hypothetical protein VKY92_07415 [Verrucomicrobiae bacterium]|nr:hypothetical protein [Verrucomicrobiae bacterium]
MIDTELLKVLCCPETRQPVRPADAAIVQQLNANIAAGTLKDRTGRAVSAALSGGLIRADGKILYPVRGDIPVMLVEEGIPLQ